MIFGGKGYLRREAEDILFRTAPSRVSGEEKHKSICCQNFDKKILINACNRQRIML